MAEQMTDFIRQTLHSLVRRLENSNEDNLDSVYYVSEQVISLIRDAKDLVSRS